MSDYWSGLMEYAQKQIKKIEKREKNEKRRKRVRRETKAKNNRRENR